MKTLSIAIGQRTCTICDGKIHKGDLFIDACFRGYSESHTKNICLLCLLADIQEVSRKEIRRIKEARLLEEL